MRLAGAILDVARRPRGTVENRGFCRGKSAASGTDRDVGMNIGLFFEGTGRGVAGKITNVTRLRDICVEDARQKLHCL